MTLKKDNISFRAVEPTDIDVILNWENNPETWHLSNTLMPFSRFDIEQFVISASKDIFASKQLRLMIIQAEDNTKTAVGCIDLFDFDALHKRAGVGILIDKNYRKQGIAGTAIDLLATYAFEILNLHQLYCNIESDNDISLKLFQDKGFKIIGLKKDWNQRSGKWIDEYLLQLINKI